MTKIRGLLILAAAACFVYGLWKLWLVGISNLVDAAKWLIGGVIIHDGLIAPVVVVAGIAAVRVLPRWAQAPFVIAAVVFGTTTLFAIPVLGRFGARPDNPSLLNRPYLTSWLILGAVTVAAAVAASMLRRNRSPLRRGQVHRQVGP